MLTKRSLVSLLLITPLLSGCYLGHVAAGQAKLLLARRPIDTLVADPETPATLRGQLERVQEVRRFAEGLGLSVRSRYRHYAPWPGDRVVTTLVATRPGRVEPAGFWFPIVGRVPYKGYFDASRAGSEAERLRAEGLDVCEVPVRAYSTLGWFDDPVTGPMLRQPEARLVETLLHELLHATVFVPGQADWNEGVASFVGEEAGIRFYAAREGRPGAQREMARVAEQRSVRAELLSMRAAVERLYAETPPGADRERARSTLEREARGQVAALSLAGRDAGVLAAGLRLNDACLALTATYAADTACYAQRLGALGGDLADFVARVLSAAEAPDPRSALLGELPCPAEDLP